MGESWREALTLGVLMNTRGLVELIVFTIGLILGLLSPTFFPMLVIMALVTTMMASPLLPLLGISTTQFYLLERRGGGGPCIYLHESSDHFPVKGFRCSPLFCPHASRRVSRTGN